MNYELWKGILADATVALVVMLLFYGVIAAVEWVAL